MGLTIGAAFLLAALQLWPTYRLARLASARRDFEYLSGFAVSPIHLVSYLAPGLFQRSPLWRPLAWDPFHTSPEEHLAYIGLVPLYLALGVTLKSLRRAALEHYFQPVAVVNVGQVQRAQFEQQLQRGGERHVADAEIDVGVAVAPNSRPKPCRKSLKPWSSVGNGPSPTRVV